MVLLSVVALPVMAHEGIWSEYNNCPNGQYVVDWETHSPAWNRSHVWWQRKNHAPGGALESTYLYLLVQPVDRLGGTTWCGLTIAEPTTCLCRSTCINLMIAATKIEEFRNEHFL